MDEQEAQGGSTPPKRPAGPPPTMAAPRPGAPPKAQPQGVQGVPSGQDFKGPVWDGDHEDHAWRLAASKKLNTRSRSEQLVVQAGPKRHPFPERKVHVEEVLYPDGSRNVRYFRDAEAANAWKSGDGAKDEERDGARINVLSGERPQEGPEAEAAQEQERRSRAEAVASVALPNTTLPAETEASSPAPVQARIDHVSSVEQARRVDQQAMRRPGAAGSPTEARKSRSQRLREEGS